MSSNDVQTYVYLNPVSREARLINDARLAGFSERHKVQLTIDGVKSQTTDAVALARESEAGGIVVALTQGWPGYSVIRLAKRALRHGLRVFFYWPAETAIEVIDAERVGSYFRHWVFINLYRVRAVLRTRAERFAKRALGPVVNPLRTRFRTVPVPVPHALEVSRAPRAAHDRSMSELDALVANAAPVNWTRSSVTADDRIPGTGVYLRTDFWAPITSGGSYGHTCYVVKSLSKVTENTVAFMANRFPLLDAMGIHQVVMDAPGADGSETTILAGTSHYYLGLRYALAALRPAFIYERICLGNYVGVKLSQELQVPYIVEYNGSEISMKRSFDSAPYDYEDLYIKAEDAAFAQASLISVVSKPVRDDLVKRGVDPRRILVNPNGADPDVYQPPSPEEKAAIRRELGFEAGDQVIGFSGTFGGWHGVDVLAEALPLICERASSARVLLIGDGNYKRLVDDVVNRHALGGRVVAVGRVPQSEGARLLRACDIFVSPHNSHMVDSRFFGSPTKIFEYMSMGGGIVASDLEQIGEVLSPALRSAALTDVAEAVEVTGQRSVLCEPGDVDEFVNAVVYLCKHPEVAQKLGANARQAIIDQYSWDQHVAHLWPALTRCLAGLPADESMVESFAGENAAPASADAPAKTVTQRLDTGDAYKEEVQNQWNNNACGSHYVKQAALHTLAWYKEAEAYRFGEYAPWMHEVMEFAGHRGHQVLEIGGGMGTDLAQFAINGAHVTDVDLSGGHLAHAQENFQLRGLDGRFVHHDAENLPFDDDTFDVVYSNGVIHHTPNTVNVVREIYRVLKPGGKAIIMVYAENSLHYWRNLVRDIGIREQKLMQWSMGEIMSRSVEISETGARPLVKVYTPKRLENLFRDFTEIEICQRQMVAAEHPRQLNWLSLDTVGKLMGWNLIIKATKPA